MYRERGFFMAKPEEVKKGLTTDIYFVRTVKILKKLGLDKTNVSMEITANKIPFNWTWGILTGTWEVAKLMENIDLDLYLMKEGTLFKPADDYGVRMPVGYLTGEYGEFAVYETPLLGLLCQNSGIATYAAHLRLLSWGKTLLSFGARRMHPIITPMIDYSAYVAGFDGVSSILSAEILGVKPQGTMPHALILIIGDQVKAWRAFDEYMEPEVKRIALVDTFYDEKIESLLAADTLKEKLFGVRLDTPGSRRGDMKEIIREVKWELNIRGYGDVKIIVSGGVNHENIKDLVEGGADGFGIGTSVSNAPTLDFALDVVEKEGEKIAKRGKLSGRKQVYRCPKCFTYKVVLNEAEAPRCPRCGSKMEPLIEKMIGKGRIIKKPEEAERTREYVLDQLKKIRELDWGE